MKHTLLLTTIAVAASSTLILADNNSNTQNEAVSQEIKICSFRELPPLVISQPMLLDSLDAKGIGYTENELLDAKYLRDIEQTKFTTVAAADTSCIIKMPEVSDKPVIREYVTSIRAERFAKGSLSVSTETPYRLYVNGVENQNMSVTLEPQSDNEIRLRLLQLPGDTTVQSFAIKFTADKDFNDVAVYTGIEKKRRFALADSEFGPRVSDLDISPDGKWLLLRQTDKNTPQSTDYSLSLINLANGKTTHLNPYDSYSWMPTGATLCVAVKSDDAYDLFSQNPVDGARKLLAKGLPQNYFYWNNAADKLYFTLTDEGNPNNGPLYRYTSPDDRIPGNRNISYVSVFDIASGAQYRLTRGSMHSGIADFHPNADKLLLMSSRVDETKWPFSFSSLYEFDSTTGKLDTIIAETGFLTNAIYSPDGNKLLITAPAQAFGGIADRSGAPIASLYDQQLFILDRTSGDVKAITTDFDPSVGNNIVWNRADGNIYFSAVKGFGDRVYRYSPSSGKIEELPLEIEHVTAFSMGAYGTQFAYRGMSHDHSGEARLFNLRSGKDTQLADPYATHLAEIDMANFERWTFTASDGTEIEGYCITPPEFNPQKKYPLIVYYYGGTLPTQFSLSSPYNPQIYAARDYVVYMLNPSGTIGYGQEFSARHVNAWGKRTAEDIIEGTKQFVKEHPFVNADKIGCIGASYGGFMTQYLQTLTDIFAAAVSHAGISDVTSYWGEGYWGYSYNAVAASQSYPWSNPELFTQQGSLFNADKINTPLLLLHGTADTNVPTGESIQLFNALKILGREVELITVEGENHFISDYPKRKMWNDTALAWFAKWLQDDPRWWNSMYK